MSLTNSQKVTLKAALLASTDPVVQAAVAALNMEGLAVWCNQKSNVDAWATSVSRNTLFEAMNIANYDNLTAGKRISWQLVLDCAPVDASRNKLRKGITDIWSAADADVILTDCLEKANNGEVLIGGNNATSGSVTGLKRDYVGNFSADILSQVWNAS